jgi:hypothetical protein
MNKVDYYSMNLTKFKKSTLTKSNILRQMYKGLYVTMDLTWISQVPDHFNLYTEMAQKA